MSNDLISRSELKKHKFTVQIRNGVAIGNIEVVSVAEIDNAPTVEYPFYQEAYQTGYEEGKNERPQGENKPLNWIDRCDDDYLSEN